MATRLFVCPVFCTFQRGKNKAGRPVFLLRRAGLRPYVSAVRRTNRTARGGRRDAFKRISRARRKAQSKGLIKWERR